jgi:predicted RNA-binding Zn-ribbon protein involved in translation (DUF1610 family)
METSLPENVLTCTQCGGELHPDEGQIFLTCPFCSSTVYLDKARVVFHWYLAPTLDEAKARGALSRWMAGNQTVKDLDRKASITELAFQFFPMWYFKTRQANGREAEALMPGAATAVSEIVHLRLPAGDLRKYDQQVDPQAVSPTVPLRLPRAGWLKNKVRRTRSLSNHWCVPIYRQVHLPGKFLLPWSRATGEVIANIFPARPKRLTWWWRWQPWFSCARLIPVIGGMVNGSGALAGRFGLCAAGIIAAPVLFALAAWVAAKV